MIFKKKIHLLNLPVERYTSTL